MLDFFKHPKNRYQYQHHKCINNSDGSIAPAGLNSFFTGSPITINATNSLVKLFSAVGRKDEKVSHRSKITSSTI